MLIAFIHRMRTFLVLFTLFFIITVTADAQKKSAARIVNVGEGWASNSVNTVVFRKNSLFTWRDTQFVAYYNQERFVVLGKRKQGTNNWVLKQTPYQGNTADAHNDISIIVDGDGYLHISWDHHNNSLRYARGLKPGSLELSEKQAMLGTEEKSVTYPEFYKIPDGNLLFFYRDGGSGRGDLIINKYDTKTQKWARLQNNLISGQGQRNAYWQAFLDHKGTIHVSWVWRESPDVASNHDMAYACSKDGGLTWQKSTGEKYTLPITAASAEYACRIPQKSELINQTSMSADKQGNPYIATYWRDANSKVPHYHIIYHDGKSWNTRALNFRTTAFSLSGAGTKRIPISRPQVMMQISGSKPKGLMIFRDEERGSKVSVVELKNLKKSKWKVFDLTQSEVGSWEPTFDTELWKDTGKLNLFIQNVKQVDGEGKANIPAQMVQVLEWKPNF